MTKYVPDKYMFEISKPVVKVVKTVKEYQF